MKPRERTTKELLALIMAHTEANHRDLSAFQVLMIRMMAELKTRLEKLERTVRNETKD